MWEHPDLDDDDLPGDEAPPEAEVFGLDDPKQIPPDEGDGDARLKEADDE